MQQLLTNFMVVRLEEFYSKNLGVCTIACLKDKKYHEKFSKECGTRATNVLSPIHCTMCGPMQTSTHFTCTYFITFIDDYTRYTTMYLLHHKFNALEKFKSFKQLIAHQTNVQIKVLKIDNGSKCKSN
jgi:hypothetical protein